MSLFSIGNASTETIVFFLANHELLLDLSMIYIDMCMWSHWSTLLGTITYLLPIWHFWVDVSPFPVNGGICWSSSSGLLRGHLLANFHGCKFSNLLHVFFLKWEWLKTRGSCSFFFSRLRLVFFSLRWTGIKKGLEVVFESSWNVEVRMFIPLWIVNWQVISKIFEGSKWTFFFWKHVFLF